MLREVLANKWSILGIVFLILFLGACYLWYQHTTGLYRQELSESVERAPKLEKIQKANNHESVRETDVTFANSDLQTADKPVNITEGKNENVDTTEILPEMPSVNQPEYIDKMKKVDTYVSAHGFGPFPKVPSDYPRGVIWNSRSNYESLPAEHRINLELLQRVMVKAWADGDKGFHGGRLTNGKVILMRPNTIYVKYSQFTKPDGTIHRYISQSKGDLETAALLKSHPDYPYLTPQNLPNNILVKDIEKVGIDPYQYLGFE